MTPWGVEEPNGGDTWAAITALRLLQQPIPRPDNEFTAHCQTRSGAFARVPGALPGLRDTCRALAVLAVLNDMSSAQFRTRCF